jgi:hypothetical protein
MEQAGQDTGDGSIGISSCGLCGPWVLKLEPVMSTRLSLRPERDPWFSRSIRRGRGTRLGRTGGIEFGRQERNVRPCGAGGVWSFLARLLH